MTLRDEGNAAVPPDVGNAGTDLPPDVVGTWVLTRAFDLLRGFSLIFLSSTTKGDSGTRIDFCRARAAEAGVRQRLAFTVFEAADDKKSRDGDGDGR